MTTEPHTCAYLPDRDSMLEYSYLASITPAEYEALMNRGYRKFGRMLFRPVCAGCRAWLYRSILPQVRFGLRRHVHLGLIDVAPRPALAGLERRGDRVARLVEMARQDLQQRGVPNAADAPIPAEMFAEQAERRVKLGLVLAELVKANDLQAKPEQIRAEVDEFAKSYEDPKEVVRWYYSNQQRLAEMEAYVVESNVVEFVLGKARVNDKEVSFEELASATAQA